MADGRVPMLVGLSCAAVLDVVPWFQKRPAALLSRPRRPASGSKTLGRKTKGASGKARGSHVSWGIGGLDQETQRDSSKEGPEASGKTINWRIGSDSGAAAEKDELSPQQRMRKAHGTSQAP